MVAAAESVVSLAIAGSVENRSPPHDIDAEAALLSSVMLDPRALDQVADLVRPAHFYSERHRWIFEACCEVSLAGGEPDYVQIATWLQDHNRLAQVGGPSYLTEIIDSTPATANARRYAAIVRGKWVARQVLLACQRGVAEGYTEYGSPDEYLATVADRLHNIATEHAPATTQSLSDVVRESMDDLAASVKRGAGVVGLPTGYDRYDRLTAGLHDGEVTVVAARPGMGKTSFAINVLGNVASIEGGKAACLLLSLEMPRKHIVNRWICCEARVDSARFRTGMLTPKDWEKLVGAASHLANLPVWIDDKAGQTLLDVRTKIRRASAEAERKGKRLRAVAIDYVQQMRGPGHSRENEVSEITRGLKELAKDLSLPILVLSQLNRELEKRPNKRPTLSDLRESGAIEQDADNVCFIYRDEYYHKETVDRNVAELIIAKQRNGPTDTVRVRFDAQYTRFDNLEEGEYDNE